MGITVNLVLFILVGIPSLCISCLLSAAILRSKMHFSLKVSLFPMSISLILYLSGFCFYHGTYILRLYNDIPVISCYIEVVISGLGAFSTFPQLVIYVGTVNFIVWRGINKVKNYIIVFISIAVWTITLMFAILNITPSVGVQVVIKNGFCVTLTAPSSYIYFGFLFIVTGGGSFIASLVIILVAYHKVKKSTFTSETAAFNKALLKLAVFLFISVSLLIFGFCLTPVLFLVNRGPITEYLGSGSLSLIILPLVFTLLLAFHPIRQSAKEICLCVPCKEKKRRLKQGLSATQSS